MKLMKSSFRVPLESVKKNWKNINKKIEKQNQTLILNIDKLIKTEGIDKAQSMGKIIKNYESFLAEQEQLIAKHNDYIERLEARYQRLERLETLLSSSNEVKDELSHWYKQQIDLYVCDYLIRTGNVEIGVQILQECNLDKLVDYDIVQEGLHIYNEIKDRGNLSLLIQWCNENKKSLVKLNNNTNLEFETYFQKFIELLKNGHIYESVEICKKYLISHIGDSQLPVPVKKDLKDRIESSGNDEVEDLKEIEYLDKMRSASKFLLFNSLDLPEIFGVAGPSDSVNHYSTFRKRIENLEKSSFDHYNPKAIKINELNQSLLKNCFNLYSPKEWTRLADFFIYSFNQIHGINQNIEFLILLSTGISTLKTKSCTHSVLKDVNFDQFIKPLENKILINNCPICSLELSELANSLPFSHQIISNIFTNPIMLPNGNVYQSNRLLKINENWNLSNKVKTPTKKDTWLQNKVQLFSSGGAIFKQIYDTEVMSDNSDEDSSDDEMSSRDSSDSDISSILERYYDCEEFNDDSMMKDLKLLGKFKLKDPLTKEIFNSDDLVKVYPI